MIRIKGLNPILTIAFLERISYYLLTSILVLFLIKEQNFTKMDTAYLYGYFIKGGILLSIVMGFISDLVDRKRMFNIGIILIIIGYLLFPFLSNNFTSVSIALLIIALGISIVKPNILVLLGDYNSKKNNYKTGLRDYVLFGFIVLLSPQIVKLFQLDSLTFNSSLKPVFFISATLMTISFLIYKFQILNKFDELNLKLKMETKMWNIIPIIIILIISLLLIVIYSPIIDFMNVKLSETSLTYENVSKIFSIIFSILFIITLILKRLSINLTRLQIIFGFSIFAFAITFGAFQFQSFINAEITNRNIILTILFLTLLDTITFPIIKYLLYIYTHRYKGLTFGVYYAIIGYSYLIINKIEYNKLESFIPISVLGAIGVFIILKSRIEKTKVQNTHR